MRCMAPKLASFNVFFCFVFILVVAFADQAVPVVATDSLLELHAALHSLQSVLTSAVKLLMPPKEKCGAFVMRSKIRSIQMQFF